MCFLLVMLYLVSSRQISTLICSMPFLCMCVCVFIEHLSDSGCRSLSCELQLACILGNMVLLLLHRASNSFNEDGGVCSDVGNMKCTQWFCFWQAKRTFFLQVIPLVFHWIHSWSYIQPVEQRLPWILDASGWRWLATDRVAFWEENSIMNIRFVLDVSMASPYVYPL